MARRPALAKLAAVDEACAHWKYQIELAEDDCDKWVKRGDKILKRYRDDRPDADGDTARGDKGRYNIFWSNVQTLRPCIYGREPVPIAERRFLDKDPVGRAASQILERAMRYEMMDCGFHDTVQRCVFDYLTVGRGVPWIRYTPAFGPATSLVDRGDDQLQERDGQPVEGERSASDDAQNESNESTNESQAEKLVGATVHVDYINWKDFLHSRARTWDEVEWIAKRVYMSRQDLVDNFGKKVGNAVPLDHSKDERRDREAQTNTLRSGLQKATVYEIWCKYDRTVRIVAKEYNEFLEEPREDPLNLEGFWPVPKPLYATMTNDTLLPVPDYAEYQDQAYELDRLTQRLDLLVAALQVRGVYNAANKELARLLEESNENKMIPIASWAGFGEKGGLKGAVDFMPIEVIAETIKSLFEAREQVKKDLYEITGLADVIRGQSDPRETAQAVATKGRFGSLRLQERQGEVARFCRDLIRMMGEIISEHYPNETLIDISGIMYDEGIGPMMPTPPKKPDEQASNPMLGHNGGPPMSVPQGSGSSAAPPVGGPGSFGIHPPTSMPSQGAAVPPGLSTAPGTPPSPIHPSQGLQPPGASPSPQPGQAPPAIPPQLQYAMDMAQYEMKRQAAEAEKQQLVERAVQLLRQDKLRGFRIDIETDSTVVEDANEDKAQRVEFIQAVSAYLEKAMQAVQLYPQMLPLLGKLMLFAVRGFRVGRDLESSIEEFIDRAEKDVKANEGKPKAPDPKVMAEQIKAQAEVQKAQTDAQSSADDNRRAMQQKAADAQIAQQKAQAEQAQMDQDAQFKEKEFQMKLAEMEAKLQLAEREMQMKLELMEREHEHKLTQTRAEHEMQTTQAHADHEMKTTQARMSHKHAMHQAGAKAAEEGEEFIDPDQQHREELHKKVDEHHAKHAEHIKELHAGLSGLAGHVENLHKQISAPKRIVRDANGRAVGVELAH